MMVEGKNPCWPGTPVSAPTPSACICRSSGQLARPPGKLTVKGASAARPARRRNCATRAASGWAARVPRHTRDASRCNPATQPAWPIAFSAAGTISSRAPGQTPASPQAAPSIPARPLTPAASQWRTGITAQMQAHRGAGLGGMQRVNTRGSAVCMPRAVSTVISRAISRQSSSQNDNGRELSAMPAALTSSAQSR